MNVKVNVGISSFKLPIGPFDPTVGPFDITALGTELAQGDTAFAPLILGWHSGNFWWNLGVFGFAPTGEYSKRDLANTSLHHWAEMTRLAGTYYNPETGFEVTGAAVYSVNWENTATDYETGNIFNLEGAITKNFGALGVGGVGYAMIQTTAGLRRWREAWLLRVEGLWRGPHRDLYAGGRDPHRAYASRQMVCRVRRGEHLRRQHRGRGGDLQVLTARTRWSKPGRNSSFSAGANAPSTTLAHIV